VSVALRPDRPHAWVANHLSDSISIVDIARGELIATLAVGDEPTDVAFAAGRAFVGLAGIEDRVAVYDPDSGREIASVPVFSDEPRALAVHRDGTRVAVVALESGNGTSLVRASEVRQAGGAPSPVPPRSVPNLPPGAPAQGPRTALIARFDAGTGTWQDETGQDWTSRMPFTLADEELFWIDAGGG
jgi:YVTN family beta-propeller protein